MLAREGIAGTREKGLVYWSKKRLKATMGVFTASARYAVLSKRRDGCLLGSSVTESPGDIMKLLIASL